MTPLPDKVRNLLICPACRGRLTFSDEGCQCTSCARAYPERFGIYDLRVSPDPYITVEDELAKTEALLRNSDGTFAGLVHRYYDLSPEVPASLCRQYESGLLRGEMRGRKFLDGVERLGEAGSGDILLDLGCGTAGMCVAASKQYSTVIGIDVALRWLRIGEQRLAEAKSDNVTLLCANAEALPLADGVVNSIVSDSALEHFRGPEAAVEHSHRVLRPGGHYFFSCANRHAALDPYTRIPLPGLIPREVLQLTMETVAGTPYRARPLSKSDLRRLFGTSAQITAPERLELGTDSVPWIHRVLAATYNASMRLWPLSRLMERIAPFLYVIGRKEE